jgi:Neocarzinostatin family
MLSKPYLRGAVAVAGLALAFASLAAPAATAEVSGTAGATPAVRVAPNTNLVDLQVVRVVSTGFTPDSAMAAVMCATPAGWPEVCDYDHPGLYTANGRGAGSTDFAVHRTWVGTDPLTGTVWGKVNCDTAASGCNVGVTDEKFLTASAPVKFKPLRG